MATIGYGYGSEWHLLQHMGRRRKAFSAAVETATGHAGLQWLDSTEYRDKDGNLKLREIAGLEFLGAGDPVREEWERLWPQSGNVHNWDAVGRASTASGGCAWVLVEAKGHIDEVKSSCTAKAEDSLVRIRAVLEATRRDLCVKSAGHWMADYYQYCNRIALLHFLLQRKVTADLVFVYFAGDRMDLGRAGRECPVNEAGWRDGLRCQDDHVGLPAESLIRRRVHRIFLPAYRANIAEQVLRPEFARVGAI